MQSGISDRSRVNKNGALLAQPFVTLNVDASGERGLLGVAFDPDVVAAGQRRNSLVLPCFPESVSGNEAPTD